MQVVIVEDEHAAVNRLRKMLKRHDPTLEIQMVLDSVDDAISWFNDHPEPDLLFLDVQLSDGISFEIFDVIKVRCPIIFTTAYDEYAIRAFKLNSIDYLLKPVVRKELENAMEKYHKIRSRQITNIDADSGIGALLDYLQNNGASYKSRFLVKLGDAYHVVSSEEILHFHISNQLVELNTISGQRFIIEHALDQIEKIVDPKCFFRINRQMIVAFQGIKSIRSYFNSRLKLTLNQDFSKEIIVSRDKVTAFKRWLDR